MSFPKIEEVRSLNDEEIAEQILATKKELFELRFQQATRRLEKPHLFKHKRHRLGQLLTVERQRQIAAAGQQSEASVPAPPATDE
ncbi:MAG: 50S ribosomal protein L29 [Geitlerinemataceae cyanobacterium]